MSQGVEEMIRLNDIQKGATARSLAVGGAMSALGADFSTASSNPAGIGLFRSGEITVTPGLHYNISDATYQGNADDEFKATPMLSQFGVVFHNWRSDKRALRNINYGFGYNRMANYNQNRLYSGINADNSLIDYFLEQANGLTTTEIFDSFPFSAALSLNTGVVRPLAGTTTEYSSLYHVVEAAGTDVSLEQMERISSAGGYDEFSFSAAFNFSDTWYLGFKVGFPTYSFDNVYRYTETDIDEVVPEFANYRYQIEETIEGSGFNGSIGVIYRINNQLRAGLQIESPTIIAMEATFLALMESDLDDLGEFSDSSGQGLFGYDAITPARINAGISYLYRKGFVSADVGLVPAGWSRYNFSDRGDQTILNFEQELNREIGNALTLQPSIRVGSEYVPADRWRLRAGLAYLMSPTQDKDLYGNRINYSIGTGYRLNRLFLDLTGVLSNNSTEYLPYSLSEQNVDPVLFESSTVSLLLTVGWKVE